ncbi:MAG: GtrA family protein [Actinomycetota bacterium]|nr:GtrA family protein [Actinomycetota bacterium]MDQ2957985.1 GtrA family protein [Actinomycetota bacterium]
MKLPETGRVVRFVAANGVGTIVDISLVTVLRHFLGLPILLAVFCGWLASALCGFGLNRRFVFSDGRASLFTASWRYLVMVVFNFAVGVLAVSWLVNDGWNYVLTRLLSSAFLVTCNFVLARQWVFGVGTAEPQLTLVSTPDPASAD